MNNKHILSFPAYIKSSYYIEDDTIPKKFENIQDAWETLKTYATIKHEQIIKEFGPDKEIMEINETNYTITIKKLIRSSQTDGSELSTYINIKDPVILNPLSANIKLNN